MERDAFCWGQRVGKPARGLGISTEAVLPLRAKAMLEIPVWVAMMIILVVGRCCWLLAVWMSQSTMISPLSRTHKDNQKKGTYIIDIILNKENDARQDKQ